MASPFVAASTQAVKNNQSGKNNSSTSPRNNSITSPRTMKRAWSSNDSSYTAAAATTQFCVCAPSTHAGSFKCRLHRVNSHGPSSPPPTPQPAVSSSSTRTVEAL